MLSCIAMCSAHVTCHMSMPDSICVQLPQVCVCVCVCDPVLHRICNLVASKHLDEAIILQTQPNAFQVYCW